MSFTEAKEDGIRFRNAGPMTEYFPCCADCGEEVRSLSYVRGNKYKCKGCRLNDYLSDKENRINQNSETKERKFQNAVARMSKAGCHGDEYRRAADTIHKKLHRAGWFDSTEEIMVAMELVRRNVKARHQVKFGRYRADFVLPELKVVLEVDGRLFHTKKHSSKRNLARQPYRCSARS